MNDPVSPRPPGGPRRSWREGRFRAIDDSEKGSGWATARAFRRAGEAGHPTSQIVAGIRRQPLAFLLGLLVILFFVFGRRWGLL